jgi:hypothetical protein
MRRMIACAGLAALLALSPSARADKVKEPSWKIQKRREALFTDGQKLVEEKKWRDALQKFREVERLKSHPYVMLWIALCEDNLGHLRNARVIYARAQVSAREANLPEVEEDATKAKDELAARIPHVVVHLPAGVQGNVTIDAARFVLDKGRADLDPGKHTIVITAPGRMTHHEEITIKSGEERVIDAPLPLLPPPPPPPPPEDRGLQSGPLAVLIGGGILGATGIVFLGVGYGGTDDGFRAPGVGLALIGGLAIVGGGVWAGASLSGRRQGATTGASSISFSAAPTKGGAFVNARGAF